LHRRQKNFSLRHEKTGFARVRGSHGR